VQLFAADVLMTPDVAQDLAKASSSCWQHLATSSAQSRSVAAVTDTHQQQQQQQQQ
jgi:hypothetical protein